MSADKGPVTAIEVARAAGMPMLLAGKLRGAAEQALLRARGATAPRRRHRVRRRDRPARARAAAARRARAGQPDRLGRAVRARDGRGHGLRRAGDRHAARLGARDRRGRSDGLDRADRRRHGRGGRALRRDRPARMSRHGRVLLLARAHGGRLRGRLPRRRSSARAGRSPLARDALPDRRTACDQPRVFGRREPGRTVRPLPNPRRKGVSCFH